MNAELLLLGSYGILMEEYGPRPEEVETIDGLDGPLSGPWSWRTLKRNLT